MVAIENNGESDTVLTVLVLPEVAHVHLELQVGKVKLHPEVEALRPLSVPKLASGEGVTLLIWASDDE